jgi:PAS domain S-box-containing protein
MKTASEYESLHDFISHIRSLANSYPGGFTYVDSGQVIRMANSVTLGWLGIREEQMVGKTVVEFTGPDRYRELRPHIEKALSGEYATFDRTLIYPVAGKKEIHTVYVPDIDSNGRVRGYFSLITDLTEQNKTERALRHAHKMEALGQLSSGIAHDFNNLLMVIHGSIELALLELAESSPLRPNLDRAQNATKRGIVLTKRLLGFSKQNQLGLELLNLNKVVGNLQGFFTHSLTANIEFNTQLADDLWSVHVNAGDLEDSLLNLILNARDAMGGVGSITVRTYNLTRNGQDYAVFSIQDTGQGIADNLKDKIFEPFYTTKEREKGTGLGLSLVYGFVQRSGGEIELESELNKGTTFRILLPRVDSAEMHVGFLEPTTEPLPCGTEVVLLVDDEVDLLVTVRHMLERLGYTILEASSMQGALAILQRGLNVDLLFSDIVLSREDNGYALMQKARALQPSLKVLLTTGFDYSEQRNPGGELQPEHYILRKPYRLEDLARRVRAVLDEHR